MVVEAGDMMEAMSLRAPCWASPERLLADCTPPPGPPPAPRSFSPPGLSTPYLCTLPVQRPVIHPLSSPSNRFCVTSLDPDTLPAVATLLMDVMFYSNG